MHVFSQMQSLDSFSRHENRRGLFGKRKGPVEGGQERVMEVNMIKVLYILYENVIMKPIILYN
jgi:hypothetical protein